jgi:hypothetical protein
LGRWLWICETCWNLGRVVRLMRFLVGSSHLKVCFRCDQPVKTWESLVFLVFHLEELN